MTAAPPALEAVAALPCLSDAPPELWKVDLIAEWDVEGLVDGDPEVRRETRVFEELPASAKPGTSLGEVAVEVDGEPVGESPLVAKQGYDEASLWERVWYTVVGIFA